LKPAFTLLAAIAAAIAIPAMAQVRPQPGGGDPRIQTVMYDADQVVSLQVPGGYELKVEFAPDERIENVAVGDSGATVGRGKSRPTSAATACSSSRCKASPPT